MGENFAANKSSTARENKLHLEIESIGLKGKARVLEKGKKYGYYLLNDQVTKSVITEGTAKILSQHCLDNLKFPIK